MTRKRLSIFLSYVSEDQQFATVIAERLTSAFKRSVELKYMSQFQLGVNFRTLIDQSLDNADILLVIATGHEKLSHSFTGYEVGFFRKSQQTRQFIADSTVERLIIPVAMFADLPATVSDIEGIGIAESDRFLFDPDLTATAGGDQGGPFFALLTRIDKILDTLDPVERSGEQTADLYEDYREESRVFYRELAKVLNTLPLRRDFPKTRLSLRLPADYTGRDVELDDRILLACYGPTLGIFEREQSAEWFPWSELAGRIGVDDLASLWKDALRSLIASATAGDFANSDQLVFSFDDKKLFRLFLSKSTTYFDRTRELDIYLVEVLRHNDAGDPFTTFLAKALVIALRYRSLFLEANSSYGPIAMRFTKKEAWKQTISAMLMELRLLLMQSREAGLSERRHIIELYGSDNASVDAVVTSMKTWVEQKAALHRAAELLLRQRELSEVDFETFLTTLGVFCAETKKMNATFTSKILERLGEVVKEG